MRLKDQNGNNGTSAIIPWVIVVLMTGYVFLLSFYATHRTRPEPGFDFYNATSVDIYFAPVSGTDSMNHLVQGTFNNIIEGERQIVNARQLGPGKFRLDFEVKSPRPATLFLNDEALEVFLVPDSVLKIHVNLNPDNGLIDSLGFMGNTAGICQYYRERSSNFGRRDIRSYRNTVNADSLPRHAHLLDSLVIQELAYLLMRAKANSLPLWFMDFEKNEILYQKAYLKLANAYNREVYPGYLDQVEVDNQDAVFSYYYYLYLRTLVGTRQSADGNLKRHVEIADSMLSGEVRDVYLTNVIFDQLRFNHVEEAHKLFQQYEGSFSSKKYERFLRRQLNETNDA